MTKQPKFNMREFIRKITLREGGKISLPIGQVGEVVKLTIQELAALDPAERERVVARYRAQ